MKNKSNSYYIFLPEDDLEDVEYDEHLLGEIDCNNTFWTGTGIRILMNITKQHPELIESVIIKDQNNKTITVEQFMKTIEKLKIKNSI
jgi:hypothetical protein